MLKTITKEKKIQFYSFPLFLVYSILSCFIIPSGSFSYALLLLPILLMSVLYELITERIKFQLSDIFISFALLFCSIAYDYSRDKLGNALGIILLLLVCRYPQSVNRKVLYPLYLSSLIGIIYKLMTTQHWSGIRIIHVSPNYSAFVMLLFLMFCLKNRYLMGVILSLSCAIMFLSRGYFLSLLVFSLIWLNEVKVIRLFYKGLQTFLPKRIPVIVIILLVNAMVFSYSIYYVNKYSLDDVNPNLERGDISRVTNLEDRSNYGRWSGIKETYDILAQDHTALLFGIREQQAERLDYSPHNSIMTLLSEYGLIYSVFYLLGFGLIVKRVYQPGNLKYTLAPFTHALVLHGLLGGVYTIFLSFILTLIPHKGKWRL